MHDFRCGVNQARVGRFCKNNLATNYPHDIYTATNCLEIRLYTSSSSSSKDTGFSGSYQSFSYGSAVASTCSRYKVSLHKTITSLSNYQLEQFQKYGQAVQEHFTGRELNIINLNIRISLIGKNRVMLINTTNTLNYPILGQEKQSNSFIPNGVRQYTLFVLIVSQFNDNLPFWLNKWFSFRIMANLVFMPIFISQLLYNTILYTYITTMQR